MDLYGVGHGPLPRERNTTWHRDALGIIFIPKRERCCRSNYERHWRFEKYSIKSILLFFFISLLAWLIYIVIRQGQVRSGEVNKNH